MKGMITRFAISIAAAGLLMAAGSVSAQMQQQVMPGSGSASLSINQGTLDPINQALRQMQAEMIDKNYKQYLLMPQMRSKMMAERTPQNFMQDSIQPVMMERMREQIKPQQMQVMQNSTPPVMK